ncbi:imm11 family protein [Tenacibaculum sp. C7A-26P2]|uniref:imm11 family protein n=1 Tax=Tenacibaculum sp. C7A-26P2 TaxID=3447504 RepID=UPI003F82B2B1
MKYYSISWDYDNLEVIGHYPQTSLKKGYNPSLPDSHWAVEPHSFPNFIPNLELELHKDANATDYLHFGDISGIIVSGKFRAILKKINLPPHAFYPIKVYLKGTLLEYFWFHYAINDFFSWLDKEESKAIIYDDKNGVYKVISELNLSLSLEEIEKINQKLPWHQRMKWEKIIFKKEFPKYDVYKTRGLDLKNFISERLLNALLDTGMTGFTSKPIENIICK